MNAQHRMIKIRRRVRRLAKKLDRLQDGNVYRSRISKRLANMVALNPQTKYLTVLG